MDGRKRPSADACFQCSCRMLGPVYMRKAGKVRACSWRVVKTRSRAWPWHWVARMEYIDGVEDIKKLRGQDIRFFNMCVEIAKNYYRGSGRERDGELRARISVNQGNLLAR